MPGSRGGHVSHMLGRYRPQDQAEAADVERVRALADSADDPWLRSIPLHVTGSALIVHPDSGRVLLRWHQRQHAWLQVGGHADPGESDPLAIALREAAEETGLTDLVPWPDAQLRHVVIVPVPASSREPAHEHADLRFVLATRTPDAARAETPDAPLRWLSPREAREISSEANLRETVSRAERLLKGGSRALSRRELPAGKVAVSGIRETYSRDVSVAWPWSGDHAAGVTAMYLVGETADAGDTPGPVSGPPARLYLTEPARGLAGLAVLPLAAPWLAAAPRGDGHGVLIVPGLLASDMSTALLRRFLGWLGYEVHGWDLGRNLGPTDAVLEQLPQTLAALAESNGGPVSVVGWSLGGIYARELARQRPAQVRQVITLGSPFALTDPRQSRADGAYRRRSYLHADRGRMPTPEQIARPISVPSTAVYSRRDGIVSWQTCIEPETALHENVEVRCAHLGFGTDPATLWVIADRLATTAGRWRPFRPPTLARQLYPR